MLEKLSHADTISFLKKCNGIQISEEGGILFKKEIPYKDQWIIDFWNEEIYKYLKKLGLNKIKEVPKDKIFLVNPKENFGKEDIYGIYDDLIGEIYLSNKMNRVLMYKTLLHEMIHYWSYLKFILDIDKNVLNGDSEYVIIANRLGYSLNDIGFYELNEAITEYIANKIWEKNLKKLKNNSINLDDYYINKSYYISYFYEIQIYTNLLREVEKKYSNFELNFERGYFDGSKMFLRKIEKVYGKNFLRILEDPQFVLEKIPFSYKEFSNFFKITSKKSRIDFLEKVLQKNKNIKNTKELINDYLIRVNSI